jgi:hypothetical protein
VLVKEAERSVSLEEEDEEEGDEGDEDEEEDKEEGEGEEREVEEREDEDIVMADDVDEAIEGIEADKENTAANAISEPQTLSSI